MVSNLSRQFMIYETSLKKLAEKQAMNERGFKNATLTELDRSPLQGCVERQASFARPNSVDSENRLTAMCSDGNTKSTDDSSSVLRQNVASKLLERNATPVEFDERQEASEHWIPIETAPASVHCLSTTATDLVYERESCVTSRESHHFHDQLLEPEASHYKAGEEDGSPIDSITGKDMCVEKRLHTDKVVWQSIEAQGGSPVRLSKAQRISIQDELRRVAASSGQKARLLEGDTADLACAIVDVQIEERMELPLRPNTLMCHVIPDSYVIRVSHEETSSEYSDPLEYDSDNNALECAEREAAGNSSVSAFEDEGCDELQATFTNEHFRKQARAHNQNPVCVELEPLPSIITSKIDTQNQTSTVCEDPLASNGILRINSKQRCTNMMSVKGAKTGGNSPNLQAYKSEVQIEGRRDGKRKRSEEDILKNGTKATKLEAGLASSIFPSNYVGVCFGCKGSLTSEEKVDCSRNDCGRLYHLNCAIGLSDASWSYEGKLVCPQHVCYACGKGRGARLWRCQNCPLATHENCIPCPEVTTLFHKRPGWAICWRHAPDVDFKLKTPTWDCQDIFRHLPVPDIPQDFSLLPEFIKEVMENEKEPPPYFFIRRNLFLIKKKRDDADDGVGCSCKSQDVCGEDCECRTQSMSCSKDCKCSDKCSNKPFRKDKRLKVCKTAHCGWGAFAAEAIKKDEFVIEYTGEVINDAMCEKRLWEMKGRRSICNFYMCEIAKDFIIDATRKGNASRYLNHSCLPNCRLEKWRVDGETRVGVFAGRNIAAGEELNYDYKYVEFGPNVTCRCGAPNCRGAIGERFNSNRKSNAVSFPIKWGSQHKRSSLA
ncbi:hypothetical protein M758_9G172100 [Ceratodon purpureus]|nr:hypothetical protein M758_9G172100 [Ceratodon purpureus]